ncbi:hypothetical protein [Pseudoalteromonas aurantia]|uniref:UDP-glycosyltransferase n=1 Tax=Pseudoalteromonas aurantia TaxID=43654 RepID=A0ABY2VXK5_9GAMM|nr:hypothetical protein [Pseudoalteromonas aurantia]TMO63261.1 hypothetical protein CWC18_08490 [Pseudoalteromonas aurantia]TMO74421.1 hypothetical protein CWC20_10825 [Pseudoalteromonas aurantia]
MSHQHTILLFSIDPGGANSIGILAHELSKTANIVCFAKEAACSHLKHNFPQINVTLLSNKHDQYSKTTYLQLLATIKPNVVFTDTTGRDYSNRSLWRACKDFGIPSIAILDQWMNYALRFLKQHETYQGCMAYTTDDFILPTAIVTMDCSAKLQMVKEGLPENIIHPLGSPYYESLKSKPVKNKTQKKKAITILFASEPITAVYGHKLGKKIHGYTEQTIIKTLCQSITKQAKQQHFSVIIRPHPRESQRRYNRLIKSYHFASLCSKRSVQESIQSADIVLGMSSTMLLEASLQNKPILSIQIGNHKESPFYLEQIGLLRSVRYTFQLHNVIKNLEAMRFNRYTVKMTTQNNSVESIHKLMTSLCQLGKSD